MFKYYDCYLYGLITFRVLINPRFSMGSMENEYLHSLGVKYVILELECG
jgi:hypothetical protein